MRLIEIRHDLRQHGLTFAARSPFLRWEVKSGWAKRFACQSAAAPPAPLHNYVAPAARQKKISVRRARPVRPPSVVMSMIPSLVPAAGVISMARLMWLDKDASRAASLGPALLTRSRPEARGRGGARRR